MDVVDPVVNPPTVQPTNAVDTDGDGLLEIHTVAQLKAIQQLKGYELANDIDLSGEDWLPIGDRSQQGGSVTGSPFVGTFEGNGYRIHGLTTTGRGSGLFAFIGTRAIVRNLRLEATLRSIPELYKNGIGALAISAAANSVIANVSISFSMELGNYESVVGGMLGRTESAIILNSFVKGSIQGGSANDDIGGLIGRMKGGRSIANLASVDIDGGAGTDVVGGLIGTAQYDSYSTDNVRPVVTGSYATGTVNGGSGKDHAGGIIAWLNNSRLAATLQNNYYSGDVTIGADERMRTFDGITFDQGGSRKPTLTFIEHDRTGTADCTSGSSGALDPPLCGAAMNTN